MAAVSSCENYTRVGKLDKGPFIFYGLRGAGGIWKIALKGGHLKKNKGKGRVT